MKLSCLNCSKFKIDKHQNVISIIQKMYQTTSQDWFLGFSGGKDSSALLALVIRAVASAKNKDKKIYVIFCNTGVEIPIVAKHTLKLIVLLKKYCKENNLPIFFKQAVPLVKDRYFVKVIGRGYAPPSNKFRWCTDRLRIKPVDQIIKKYAHHDSLILLGVRNGESLERDRIIKSHSLDKYILKQSGKSDRKIFAPILDLTTEDVWGVISRSQDIFGPYSESLLKLYKDASGECPTIRDPNATPCGQGRFGCWTCTVVRKDKSVKGLIESGNTNLTALYEYRNWLLEIKINSKMREPFRRNGAKGPGPFTLQARRMMLRRLLKIQTGTKQVLITKQEIVEIKNLWKLDR